MPNLRINQLKPGMLLRDNIENFDGQVLLSGGITLTEKHIKTLKAWGITEAFIDQGGREEEPEPKLSPVDPVAFKRAEEKAAELFIHMDREHPAVQEMLRLCALKKLKN